MTTMFVTRGTPPHRSRRRVPLLEVSLAFIIASTSCSKTTASAMPSMPPPAVGVSAVEVRQISPSSELTGRIEPIHNVELRPRVSGYVTAVNFREGTEVRQGATLFTIDARPYKAALARAVADLARANARVDLARAQAARAEMLFGKGAMNHSDHDIAVSTATQAAADVQAAQADRRHCAAGRRVHSGPGADGRRSGQALVSIGDYVAAGPAPTLLATVAPSIPCTSTSPADEQAFLRFASHALGASVAVGLGDESGYPHAGKIDFVDNRVDSGTGTIRLRAVVPNPDRRLTPGLYARVRLGEGKPIAAVLVDDKAILTDQDRKYVYMLGPADTVERRNIKLGRIVDGLRVIPEGLKPGDRLIVNGIQKVFPGSKATAVPITASAEPPLRRARRESLSLLHRSADLRGGRLDRHLHRGGDRDFAAADQRVPGGRAAVRSSCARSIRAPTRACSPRPSPRRSRRRSTASRTCSTCRRRRPPTARCS